MSYTKGPWNRGGRLLDITKNGKLIASVNCSSNHPATEDESHSNAHLIAAAPDLIDRLKDTNAALINWKRLIESKETGITKTEETIAYNCGLIIIDNAKIISQAEGKD